MALPKYHEFYGPIMRALQSGEKQSNNDIKKLIADKLELSESDMRMCSSKSDRPLFDYRFKRACSDLKKTGFIEIPSRGFLQITEAGKKVARNTKTDDPNEWRVVFAYNEFQRLGNEIQSLLDEKD